MGVPCAASSCKNLQLRISAKCAEILPAIQRAFSNRECGSSIPPKSASHSKVREMRKARQWRAFAPPRSVSTFRIGDLGGPDREKSPPEAANIPVFGRLSLETRFDHDWVRGLAVAVRTFARPVQEVSASANRIPRRLICDVCSKKRSRCDLGVAQVSADDPIGEFGQLKCNAHWAMNVDGKACAPMIDCFMPVSLWPAANITVAISDVCKLTQTGSRPAPSQAAAVRTKILVPYLADEGLGLRVAI